MPPSITASADWPKPGGLILRLLLAFALAFFAARQWGRLLIEALLPVAQIGIGWLDDRFGILYFGLDNTAQDTVIRLKVNLVRMVVVGTHVTEPHPKGWVEVTTTMGAMLQPLTIALGLVAAWPGRPAIILLRLFLTLIAGVLFMLIDIPLTLHAYVWDMFLQGFDPGHFSPLMAIHRFLHGGGRLGVGVVLALLVVWAVERACRRPLAPNPPPLI